MGRAPCCSKLGLHRGQWTPMEDSLLVNYIRAHGEGHWRSLPKKAGLLRCGKSCRLRWMNYLRPGIKRGNITEDEDDLIIRLHALLGNRWSLIANRLPGRTDNEIKNYWNTHLSKRLRSKGTDLNTHKRVSELHQAPPAAPPKPTTERRSTGITATTQSKINDKKRKERRNNNQADESVMVLVVKPKPVRVTPLSLARNDSNASFDTGASTPLSNRSSEDPVKEAHGVTTWPHYERSVMGEFEVDDRSGVDGNMADLVAQESAPNMLDKLYEEYLQLIKADDHLDQDGNQALELDLFAESLLI